ncbi:HAD family hydrolase [Alkalihalobacillus sp. AL-G]|uniref:HAD family hydrolase n=1 Tax=Alkalihalobacillus sp. AL-G TaxID=2926399 RepID=UPI00272BB9B9|nr:HAD-IA family hydrolase [Alkalihalobacillus sp. AL-G]WLD92302.1 HAD-IA family hydrolase [Alkalihalobacillus sp. AL-G]
MIKAVIFDLDGTLLNRDASVRKFIDDQYDRYIKWVGHVPKKEYTSRFIELDCQGYVWKDKVYQQLIDDYNIDLLWEVLLRDYVVQFKNHCVPFVNLIPMLERLKSTSIEMGMITNGNGQFQMDNIIALGIEPYFNTILVSEWEGIKKPDPQLFIKSLKQLNVEPDECIFVGDHPINDVKAAKNVGMKAVWKRDEHWGCVEADFILNDLSELPLFIDKVNKIVAYKKAWRISPSFFDLRFFISFSFRLA